MTLSKKPPSLWRNRAYLLLWGGQVISNVGSGVSQIAYPLLVLAITHSVVQAGLVGAVRSLSYVLFMLPAGALLDRWNRKRVMLVCDTCRALVLASVALALVLGRLTVSQLYVTGFLEVSLGTFFDIAELSCLPLVVTKEQVPEALGRTQATYGITNFLSPPFGGLLYSIRSSLPFLVDAISYVFSVCSLFFIRIPFQEQRATPTRNLFAEIGEGLHWLWHQPLLRSMALLTGGNVFFGAGQTLIVIIIAQQHHAPATVIGLIFGFDGVGVIFGALFVSRVQQYLNFAQIIVGALWLYTLLWLPLATLPSPLFLGLIVGTLAFISPFYNVTNISKRLAMTPDALQSRVNSVSRLIILGTAPLGLVCTGVLLQYYGPQTTILLFVGGQGMLALLAMLNSHLRKTRIS